jgi:hypothetical protein
LKRKKKWNFRENKKKKHDNKSKNSGIAFKKIVKTDPKLKKNPKNTKKNKKKSITAIFFPNESKKRKEKKKKEWINRKKKKKKMRANSFSKKKAFSRRKKPKKNPAKCNSVHFLLIFKLKFKKRCIDFQKSEKNR